MIEVQEHLERYRKVIPVFGFSRAKYDLNSIKSYLLPILINERNMDPAVIKKAHQYLSIIYGDVQFLDIMNFLGGATSLTRFIKLITHQKLKASLPMNGLTVYKR